MNHPPVHPQPSNHTPVETENPVRYLHPLQGYNQKNRTVSSLTNLMEPTLTPLAGCPKDGVHLSQRASSSVAFSSQRPEKRLSDGALTQLRS